MGKYNFNYDRIRTLEAQHEQLQKENQKLKRNLEELTKTCEALAKEVVKQGTRELPKRGFSSYISEEITEKLFNVKADIDSVVIGDKDTTTSNVTTFVSNITRAIMPFSRRKDVSKPYLTGRPLKLMTEREAELVGKAIGECAKICYDTKLELEGQKDE